MNLKRMTEIMMLQMERLNNPNCDLEQEVQRSEVLAKTAAQLKTRISKRKGLLTDEQKEFFIKHQIGKNKYEVSKLMEETFGITFTASQVASYRKNNKLLCGLDACFKKGHVPSNKGKKFPGTGNKASFKKGNVPHNVVPIGSERLSKDGYVEIKIRNGKGIKNWLLKHRYIYEKHYGPIPKGTAVMFIDQNKNNFDVNNLVLVKAADIAVLNRYYPMTSDTEMNLAKIYLTKLKRMTKEVKTNG